MKSWTIAPIIFVMGGLTVFPSCAPYYISSRFEQDTRDHREIAILPFEVIYSGKQPPELSGKDLRTIREAESMAFQISLYNEIHRSTKSGKKPIRVNVQHYRKTKELLEKNRILCDRISEYPSTELAHLLGVDAVVRSRIQKHRFLTDLESYGIDLGMHILAIVTDTYFIPLPHQLSRAKEISSDFTLIESVTEQTLWQFSFREDANWSRPSYEIINEITRKAARKFPYRN